MGRYIAREAEEYYDFDECDAHGNPVKKIRYTGREYETTINPEGAHVESGPDGLEIHTVFGDGPKTVYKQGHFGNVECVGSFLYEKGTNRTVLLECPYKCIVQAVIPNTVKKIGRWAFNECFDLQTIVLPPSVEEIHPEAFVGNRGFGEYYKMVTLTFSNKTKKIPGNLIPSNTSQTSFEHIVDEVVIPQSVTKIEANAFRKMRLFKLTLPESIEEIEPGAFSESSISRSDIPEAVWKQFKDSLLKDCIIIQNVLSGEKLLYANYNDCFHSSPDRRYTEIGDEAFAHCDIMKREKLIEVCNEIHGELHQKIFNKNSMFTVPEEVVSIGQRAFMGCTAFERIEMTDSVAYIGDEAFKDCVNLKEINISRKVTSLGDHAFDGCENLKKVRLSRELYKESQQKFPKNTEFEFYNDKE